MAQIFTHPNAIAAENRAAGYGINAAGNIAPVQSLPVDGGLACALVGALDALEAALAGAVNPSPSFLKQAEYALMRGEIALRKQGIYRGGI